MGRGKGRALIKNAIAGFQGGHRLPLELDNVNKFLDDSQEEMCYRLHLVEEIINNYPQILEKSEKEKWQKILNDFKSTQNAYKRLLTYSVSSREWVRLSYQVNKLNQEVNGVLLDKTNHHLLFTLENKKRMKDLNQKIQSLEYIPEDLKELVSNDVENFLKNRKFYIPRSHVIGACVNVIELLATFPKDTLQSQMASDFKERLKTIERPADFMNMFQLGMDSIALTIYSQTKKFKDLQARVENTFEKVNQEIFNGDLEATAFIVPEDWLTYLDDPIHQSIGQVALGFKYIRLNDNLENINFETDQEKKLYNVLVHEAIHTTQNITEFNSSSKYPPEVKVAIVEGVTEMKTEYLLEKAGRDFWYNNKINRPGSGIYRGYKAILSSAFEKEGLDFDISRVDSLLKNDIKETITFLNKNLFNTDSTDTKNLEKLVVYIRSHHRELNNLPANNRAINEWLREVIIKAGCDVIL